MAKKSKRPPARKQRPAQRPVAPTTRPLADVPPQSADLRVDDDGQEDYAATALPVSETDGPMPLPPAEDEAPQRPQVAASTATAGERRRVGRLDPGAAAGAQRPGQRAKSGRTLSTAAMFEPLPPDDAAIPFDRVPYVPGDLRRVLIIAGLMVVLVVVADIVVNAVVK